MLQVATAWVDTLELQDATGRLSHESDWFTEVSKASWIQFDHTLNVGVGMADPGLHLRRANPRHETPASSLADALTTVGAQLPYDLTVLDQPYVLLEEATALEMDQFDIDYGAYPDGMTPASRSTSL